MAGRVKATDTTVDRGTDWLVPLGSLLAGGGCLAGSNTLAKLAGNEGISALAFLAWAILGASVVLTTVMWFRRELPSMNRRTVEYFFVAALVTVAGPNLIFFLAIPQVGVGFVSLTITLPPLLTYAGALMFGMERFQARRAAGVCAALAGAAVLAVQKLNAADAPVFWTLLTLVGPLLLAIGNIYRTARWPEGESPDALAPGMLWASAGLLFAAGVLPDFSLALPVDRALPLGLVLAQTAIFSAQFLLLFILQKTGGPVLLSLLGAVGAVFAVPIAVFLLGEAPPDGLFLGAVLIAVGIALVSMGNNGGTKGEKRRMEQ